MTRHLAKLVPLDSFSLREKVAAGRMRVNAEFQVFSFKFQETASQKQWNALSLSPTLSRWEREHCQVRSARFLLPQGEGGRRPDESETPDGFL